MLLASEHHTDGRGFGPKPLIFGSEPAGQLMADVITLNPRLARDLKLLGIVAGIVVEAE
ncbi:MAG: hypothetical protein QGH33_05150 [Pirellulaceae bacterium]|nr:hypothetical protein [Pirellulaceae bacterium]HJN09336.1 hypothetical protein [Pirellulaceae bacterium]